MEINLILKHSVENFAFAGVLSRVGPIGIIDEVLRKVFFFC